MNAIGWLVRKDLLRFAADRNGAILTLVTPVILASILGAIFAPGNSAAELDILVVDLDKSEESQSLVEAMDADSTLAVERTTEADARKRVESGDASLALVLPMGTGAALTPEAMFGGKALPVTLLHDPSDKVEADLAAGLLTKIVMEQVGKRFTEPRMLKSLFTGLTDTMKQGKDLSMADRAWIAFFESGISLAEGQMAGNGEESLGGGGMKPPIEVEKEALTAAGPSAGYNSYAHNFAGMLCMFLLFWALDAGKGLVQERDQGALTRVRLAPVSVGQILTARALSSAAVALLMSAAVYAAAMMVFGVEILGSAAGFALVLVSQALFIGGFTVFLCGVGKTDRQISNYGSIAVLSMSFLGGAAVPAFLFPEWVQILSKALPTYWTTEGLAAMTWRGLGFAHALLPSGILLGLGAGLAAFGVSRYSPVSC